MRFYLADSGSGTAAWEGIWGALAAVALAAARFLPIDRFGIGFCPLRAGTGIPCFLCGGTRSFAAAAHFDFASAWHFNPLALLLFVALLAYLPYAAGAVSFGWARPRLRLETHRDRNLLRLLLAVLITGNWAYLLIA